MFDRIRIALQKPLPGRNRSAASIADTQYGTYTVPCCCIDRETIRGATAMGVDGLKTVINDIRTIIKPFVHDRNMCCCIGK